MILVAASILIAFNQVYLLLQQHLRPARPKLVNMQHTLFFILAVLPLSLGLVHKHSEVVPRGWTAANESVTATGINVTFTIALARQNIDQLESKLLEVSTPGSPSYGKHWDSDDIDAFFAPSSDAVSSVVDWLTSQSISSYQVGGAFVDFLADLSTANALLNASYNYYTNGWLTEVRTPSYSIPSSLGQHVALVDPGTYLASAKQIRRATPPRRATIKGKQDTPVRTSVDAACETSITPSCLKRMYNVGSYAPTANSTSRIGFGSFLNQSVLFDDLFQFEDHFNIPRQNISVELIADATHNQNASTAQYHEASLDVQVMVGIAHPLPVTQFVTGGAP
jgi:tripeptidyl-peptidase-1